MQQNRENAKGGEYFWNALHISYDLISMLYLNRHCIVQIHCKNIAHYLMDHVENTLSFRIALHHKIANNHTGLKDNVKYIFFKDPFILTMSFNPQPATTITTPTLY